MNYVYYLSDQHLSLLPHHSRPNNNKKGHQIDSLNDTLKIQCLNKFLDHFHGECLPPYVHKQTFNPGTYFSFD